ncbi:MULTISPECIES: GUN4 domain-containing protein [Microcystis]|jgi:hypothetical protein|uniref:GUN4-like domain-containing protein n=2 Tax=Microcystis TaxID=1125 RepID=A0A857D6Q6_MICAE|nr:MULTISPECIES: GUN4 domain-containing protein [Microcystis]MCZ8121208.1 GUN4 domain-containing protein [Microcystis sp. LE18-22.4A]QGZ91331.1 hypothetical protein GQR42_19280 [Microcystis aeruginosa FD4]TRU14711.1 MAG: hypothetical protein EWV60_02115 [Microcystis sp. Msp_OC_L_20101000_S702]TYT69974.1 hypothetical protein FXO09_18095 [Microcystis aeruginosa KLA2]BBH42055.1 hypothetical protein myaer102_46940 [Microcystis viridis NIES-102]
MKHNYQFVLMGLLVSNLGFFVQDIILPPARLAAEPPPTGTTTTPTVTPTPGMTTPTITPTPGMTTPTVTPSVGTPASEETKLYKELEDALIRQDWRKADAATFQLLLAIVGPQSKQQGRFVLEEWRQKLSSDKDAFCKKVVDIDALWSSKSGGQLGFKVQKDIFEEVGKNASKFYETIQWRLPGQDIVKVEWRYEQLEGKTKYIAGLEPIFTKSPTPPRGHLPAMLEWEDGREHRFQMIYICGL